MTAAKAERNPWGYIPLMYFLQALPVSLAMDVATILYKDFGIANDEIIRWTTLAALPFSLQMFFGPLVDLTGTRRQWVVRAQVVIAAAFVLLPFVLRLPQAFELSLAVFLTSSIFSTICNAAQDGYYLLSLNREDQARFAGVQSTCYKLGTLFTKGLLVFVAGRLMAFSSVEVTPTAGGLAFTKEVDGKDQRVVVPSAKLTVRGSSLTDEKGDDLDPPISIDADTSRVAINPDGTIVGSKARLALGSGTTVSGAMIAAPMSRRNAWSLVMLLSALVYGVLYFVERRQMPHPDGDVPSNEAPGELAANVRRTVYVTGLGIASYFAANALVRLGANALWAMRDGTLEGPLKGWRLADDAKLVSFTLKGPGTTAEVVQFVVSAAIAVGLFVLSRRSIKGSAMGTAFGSFFQQSGIVAVIGFLMLYRFGESMILRISPLFLKDKHTLGGLGLSNEDVGTIKGVVGVLGIVIGGILGGWIVSKWGLRRSIWPIAVCMHLPGLLYLWASHAFPSLGTMYGVDFVEQFGYGFGFAGYTIVLQRIALRGRFRTAHYALGVGVGALFGQVSGVLGGVIQSNFGYQGLFLAAVLLAIPGLATLLFLPLDESEA